MISRMDHVAVRLSDGVTLAVPASLSCISTYVLLEQETWFEKEGAFVRRWLKPGMTAIDIGANVGAYSLPMARLVAPDGHVTAYEPASEPRQLLEISRRLNAADNLEIVAAALSDEERQGHLAFGASSELNSLGGAGPGERIRVTCLDREAATCSWQAPDFIKIDAEGEEERILAGGRGVLDRHSPLVLFEIKAGADVNNSLRSAFARIGYDCYRTLTGEPILVRHDPQTPLDGYEINLFAAKPDRARRLAADGLLVDPVPPWTADANARGAGLTYLRARPFAAPLAGIMNFSGRHDPVYLDGLAAYAVWHDRKRAVSERCGALAFACATLEQLCRDAPSLARLSSFARCAWDWGRRTECVAALQQIIKLSQPGAPRPSEPFWPACARFDEITAPAGQGQSWFVAAAMEQLERAICHSSMFAGGPSPYLGWLCAQPFATAELERRRFLQAMRARQSIEMPPRLRMAAPDHLNATLWREMPLSQPHGNFGFAGGPAIGPASAPGPE
jgi:FkbM family methyltransferase